MKCPDCPYAQLSVCPVRDAADCESPARKPIVWSFPRGYSNLLKLVQAEMYKAMQVPNALYEPIPRKMYTAHHLPSRFWARRSKR